MSGDFDLNDQGATMSISNEPIAKVIMVIFTSKKRVFELSYPNINLKISLARKSASNRPSQSSKNAGKS